jgi:hypothetical protein
MKKLYFSLLAGLLVGAIASPFIGKDAQAEVNHKTQTFVFGQQLIVSNNITVTNTTPGARFTLPSGQNAQALVTNSVVYTNTSAGNITNTFVAPSWETDADVFTDLNGCIQTNITVTVVLNYTNFYFQPRQNFFNTGVTPTNDITLSTPTNTVTFTFQKAAWLPSWVQPGAVSTFDPNSTWSFAVIASSTGTVWTTNVPLAFLAGAMKVRLYTVATSNVTNASASGVILNNVAWSGWMP